jgi:polysaccharide export outer membrane protein
VEEEMKIQRLIASTLVCLGGMLGAYAAKAQDGIAAPGEPYRLQIGDSIDVKYRLTPEYDQTVTILPDGNVALTLLGDIHLAGLSTKQAHDEVVRHAALRLRDPDVSLSIKDSARDHFNVIGEVTKPGRYELHGRITAVEALAIAGGFMSTSSQNNVVLVHRLSDTSEYGDAKPLDFTLLKKKNGTTDMPLIQAGDVLVVSTSKTAKVERVVRLANIGLFYNLH